MKIKKGFTLIEIIIYMSLTSIIFIGIVPFINSLFIKEGRDDTLVKNQYLMEDYGLYK